MCMRKQFFHYKIIVNFPSRFPSFFHRLHLFKFFNLSREIKRESDKQVKKRKEFFIFCSIIYPCVYSPLTRLYSFIHLQPVKSSSSEHKKCTFYIILKIMYIPLHKTLFEVLALQLRFHKSL